MTRAVFDTIWTLALGPLNEAIDSTGIFRRKVKFMIWPSAGKSPFNHRAVYPRAVGADFGGWP
jgi:hypothetical protein